MPCRGMMAARTGRCWQAGNAAAPAAPSPLSPSTREEVAAVFLQLLGLGVQAPAAAAGGWGQPLPEGLEGWAALGGTEDDDGVVLHVVEALNGRGGDVQERVPVLGPQGRCVARGDVSAINSGPQLPATMVLCF